jgi:hypothetical protein
MDGGEGLREALDEIPALDQHAHLLAGPEARTSLPEVLTEATHPAQVGRVRDTPGYVRALRDLSAVLGVDPTEDAIAVARRDEGFEVYANRLLAEANLERILVDDGFRVASALSLDEQERLAGCPVHRVVRVESIVEGATNGWPPFVEVRERFEAVVADALGRGGVGLKTIAAYRSGLDLPPADELDAEAAYERWRTVGRSRLEEPVLIRFFLEAALDVAREAGRSVPLQVHTGFGDTDLALPKADPALLRWLLDEPRRSDVPIVLLHCYPFVRQASYLAGTYPNVFLDLSLAMTYLPHHGSELVLEAMDLAPASRILFATDASRLPELFYLGALRWREALAASLGNLVDDGTIDEPTALRWGRMILAGNAGELYDVGGRD